MCDFGSQSEWRIRIREISSYLDIDTRKHHHHLLNLTPSDCITGCAMENYVVDMDLKKLPQQSLNLIDVYDQASKRFG